MNQVVIYNYFRKGTWNANNGNGSFGSWNNYYINETYSSSQNINKINGCVFVKLRDSESRKDMVVGRENGVWVHWNNGSIGNVQQMGSGNANQIEKGKFSSEDTREDVIIKDGNSIKIFRNQGNGYLADIYSVAFSQTTIEKIKLKQMNDKDYDAGHWPNNENDRSDLIVLDRFDVANPKIKVFMNTNSNTFNTTVPAQWLLNIPYNAYNFEVGDVDADGYNDILISGNFGVKIYKNVQGQFINTTPIWTNAVFSSTSHMVIEDVNKDGWADLVCVGYERITKLFLNTRTSPIFGSTADQTIGQTPSLWYGHRTNATQIALSDIYNTGGIALIVSDVMNHTDPIMIDNYLKVLNAVNYNPPPQPVVIKGDLYYDNGVYRPRITINDTRRERDFYRYWVGKYNLTTHWQYAYPITSNVYIDYTEYVLPTENPEDAPPYNRWYAVIQMDLTSKWSPSSNRVYYTVGGEPTCYNCGGDNPNNGSSNQLELPREHNITNFPNPFNPVTKIYYTVPNPGRIKITVYNTLGENVKELVNSYKEKGAYIVEFDGSNLPSGVYFYRIEAGTFVDTKKMVLVK